MLSKAKQEFVQLSHLLLQNEHLVVILIHLQKADLKSHRHQVV